MGTSRGDNSSIFSRFAILTGIVWLAFCATAFSNAGSNILLVLVALPIAVSWGIFWLIRLVMSMRKKQQDEGKIKRPLAFWLFEPAVIILPLALSLLGVFSSARFALSEQALVDYVENVRAGKVDLAFEFNHPPRHTGLYTVTFTDLLPDGTVRMLTSAHRVLDRAGFANSPHDPPPRQGEDSYKHIHQQWWYWYESW
jgi:hypothetical protein